MGGMLIGVGVALLVVGVAALMMRSKRSDSGAPGIDDTANAGASATPADRPTSEVETPSGSAEAGGEAMERITLEIKGMVYGAVPPFGRLEASDEGVTFTAQSRVVGADDGGIATGDAASTIQSLGTMEFGKWTFAYTAATVTGFDTGDGEPETAIQLVFGGKTHRMVGLGGRNVELAQWLRAHGIGA